MRFSGKSDLYVQYGCGLCAPVGWVNFDASPTLRMERLLGRTKGAIFPLNAVYGDIVEGLPLDEASCRAIYSSHTLEHLSYEDCLKALVNTYKYLKPGGVFRVVVPDFEAYVHRYVGSTSPAAVHDFLDSTGLGCRNRPRGILELIRAWLGNSNHLWMWDEKALRVVLGECGFRVPRRCQFGDAGDPRFAEVEDRGRFEFALAMECRKEAG